MANKQKKYYRTEPSCHAVNVFHKDSFYRFLNISCKSCVLQSECEQIKHKREICKVADETEKLLIDFTTGRVSSFISDDFYINSNRKKQLLLPIFHSILNKYSKERNAK